MKRKGDFPGIHSAFLAGIDIPHPRNTFSFPGLSLCLQFSVGEIFCDAFCAPLPGQKAAFSFTRSLFLDLASWQLFLAFSNEKS